jgi:hypothetical protein
MTSLLQSRISGRKLGEEFRHDSVEKKRPRKFAAIAAVNDGEEVFARNFLSLTRHEAERSPRFVK